MRATELLRTQRHGSAVRGSAYNFPCSSFPVMLDVSCSDFGVLLYVMLLCTYVHCVNFASIFTCFGDFMDWYYRFF